MRKNQSALSMQGSKAYPEGNFLCLTVEVPRTVGQCWEMPSHSWRIQADYEDRHMTGHTRDRLVKHAQSRLTALARLRGRPQSWKTALFSDQMADAADARWKKSRPEKSPLWSPRH